MTNQPKEEWGKELEEAWLNLEIILARTPLPETGENPGREFARKEVQKHKDLVKKLLSQTEQRVASEVIGNIGANLLSRHCPQNVIDAYFDAANEELEKW